MINIVSHDLPCGALTTATVVLAPPSPTICELHTGGGQQPLCGEISENLQKRLSLTHSRGISWWLGETVLLFPATVVYSVQGTSVPGFL